MDIKEKCRVCLSIDNQFFSSFATEDIDGKVVKYSDMIFSLSNVEILPYDIISSICNNCKLKIVDAYKIRLQIIKADTVFRSVYNNIESTNIEPPEQERIYSIDGILKNEPLEIIDSYENNADINLEYNSDNNEDIFKEAHSEEDTNSEYESDNLESFETASMVVNDSHKCVVCGKLFDKLESLLPHVKSEHKNFKYKKIRDPISISSPNKQKRKQNRKKKEINDSCNVSESEKQQHNPSKKKPSKSKNNIEEESPVKCRECGKDYKRSTALQKHIERVHNPKVENISKYARICNICGEGFEKLSNKYYDHYRRHFPEKCLKCQFCDRLFTLKQEFKLHIQGHTGEKPLKCDLCDYRCAAQSSMKSHMRAHSADRPHKCKICGYQFKSEVYLADHLIIHTKDGAHKCVVCDKSFNRSILLKRHMIVHSDEKPFQCEYCGKHFRFKKNWKVHMRVHTGEQKYACKLCGKAFVHYGSMRYHLEKEHNETSNESYTIIKSPSKIDGPEYHAHNSGEVSVENNFIEQTNV